MGKIQTESEITKRAKILAWLTAFAMPALYIWASLGKLFHAGLGGLAILVILYIPLSVFAMILLRLIAFAFYKAVLNKNSNSTLRKRLILVSMIFIVVFICLLCITAFLPFSSVRDADKISLKYRRILLSIRTSLNGNALNPMV